MATNFQGQRNFDTQTTLHTPNVLPDIVHVDGNLQDASFLALMSNIKEVSTFAKKFSFFEDDWLPLTDTTSAANATTTSTTIDITTPLAYIPRQTWRNKRTNEVYFVEDVNTATSQITVVRQVGRDATNSTGTSAAAINSGDTLIRMGPSQGEVSLSQTAQSTVPVEIFNYAESKRWEIKMTATERKTAMLAGGGDWDRQVDKAMKQARKDINGWLYLGQRNKTVIDGQNHWFSGGVDFFISSNLLSVSGTLHEYAFTEWLQEEGMRFGPGRKTMLASSQLIGAITEIAGDKTALRRQPAGNPGVDLGLVVLSWTAPTGQVVNFIEDRFLSEALPGTGYLLDLSVIRLRDFSNHGVDGKLMIRHNTQPNDSNAFQDTIEMDMGLEVGPEKHHGKVSGVTAGAAGRPVS